MLTREVIEQLETFDGGGARVLSVYLDIAPERQARERFLAGARAEIPGSQTAPEGLDLSRSEAERPSHETADRKRGHSDFRSAKI